MIQQARSSFTQKEGFLAALVSWFDDADGDSDDDDDDHDEHDGDDNQVVWKVWGIEGLVECIG